MAIDVLSDVLRAIRLTGAVFFQVEGTSPWAIEAPHGSAIGPHLLPGVEHVISFHVITGGACWAGLLDEGPARLEAGDVIVLPHGDPHVLSSAPGLRQPPDLERYRWAATQQFPIVLRPGGGGPERFEMVCGFLGCDLRPFNPLIGTLPRLIHFSGRSTPRDGWVSQFVRFALAESAQKRPGGDCVLGKLSELMFVEVIRGHLESLPPDQTGWLAGLRDPHVGRALGLLHERPAHAWSLEELARKVALSRSTLAERFAQLIGQPPMQYLTQWRIQLAAGKLSAGGANVASIAMDVGYASEAAFSRAFKKLVGTPPAAWRNRRPSASAA